MDPTRNCKTRETHDRPSGADPADHDDGAALDVRWRTGPRTRAWSELWRRLLDGLPIAPDSDRPAADDDLST